MNKHLVVGLLAGGVVATSAGAFALRSNSTSVADIVSVTPITAAMEQQYATVTQVNQRIDPNAPQMASVVSSQPIIVAGSAREVCVDRVVTRQAPVKDEHQVVGTATGAVIGGLLGNQVGGGNGKKAATAIGAIAGGVIGKNVQENRQQANTYQTTEQECRTERTPDQTTGYEVTLDINGQVQTINMSYSPKGQLPVVGGEVITHKNAIKNILAAMPAPTFDVAYDQAGQIHYTTLDYAPTVGAKLPIEYGQVLTTPEQISQLKARENTVVAYKVLYQSDSGIGQVRMLQPPAGQTLQLKGGKPVITAGM